MPATRRFPARPALAALVAALLAAACTRMPPAQPQPPSSASPVLSANAIDAVVAAPDRTPADRALDDRRKPRELLAFIGVRAGATALDLSAGGGYTTELLARAIGPGGTVYGQSAPRDPWRPGPAAPEGGAAPAAAQPPPVVIVPFTGPPFVLHPSTPAPASLTGRSARLRSVGTPAAQIVPVQQPFDDPVPAAVADARLDLVTLVLNYHDLGHLGVDRARMNGAVFRALKPGGIYLVADHAGRPGTEISESGTLHRIEPAFLRDEVEAAGFRLAAEAGFLRNPADPRDRNTPEPPQPKDDFVMKFVKP